MATTKEKSTTRTRKRSSAAVSPTNIEQLKSSLGELPEKQKEHLSLREAIDELFDSISIALDKGYNYDEIAAVMAQHDVETTPSSLKYYVLRLRREKKAVTAPMRKTRRTKNQTAEAAAPSVETVAAPMATESSPPQVDEAAAAPAKKRTTRRTTAQSEPAPKTPAKRGPKPKAASAESSEPEAPAKQTRRTTTSTRGASTTPAKTAAKAKTTARTTAAKTRKKRS